MISNEILNKKKHDTWTFKFSDVFDIQIYKKTIERVPGFVLIFVRCPGVSKDKNNWFWGLVTVSKTQKSWNFEYWAFKIIMKSGFYYTDLKHKNR